MRKFVGVLFLLIVTAHALPAEERSLPSWSPEASTKILGDGKTYQQWFSNGEPLNRCIIYSDQSVLISKAGGVMEKITVLKNGPYSAVEDICREDAHRISFQLRKGITLGLLLNKYLVLEDPLKVEIYDISKPSNSGLAYYAVDHDSEHRDDDVTYSDGKLRLSIFSEGPSEGPSVRTKGSNRCNGEFFIQMVEIDLTHPFVTKPLDKGRCIEIQGD